MTQRSLIGWLTVGALALSMPKANGENHAHLPSFRGVCEVRASMPGRMRLFVPTISEKSQQAAQAREKLLATGVVSAVSINDRIQTVLIVYDTAQAEGAVIEGAFIRLMGLDEAISRKSMSRAEAGVRTLLDSIDHAILERTNGWLDGSTLMSGTLAACGLYRMRQLGAGVPGALTLLWWASSIFRRGGNV